MKRQNLARKALWGSSLVVVVAIGVALVFSGGAASVAHSSDKAPLPEVDVAMVVLRHVTDFETYSGRLQAIDQADIRTQVSGAIAAVHFHDGQLVKKGDLLFTIDPRVYAAEVDRAAAQVAQARAHRAYATSDAARAERLIAGNAVSRRDYDLAQNAAREASANLAAASAALELAQVNVGYTKIVAPIAGRVSRAEVTAGNIVFPGAGAAVLTTVVSVSPIYASFDVDEHTYLNFPGENQGSGQPVYLGLANQQGYPRKGVIDSIDNQLDASSGTIRVRARFDNADGGLVPGLFARVKVVGDAFHEAVLVSDAAIGTDQDKRFVLVVDAQGKVQYREVALGALFGDLREVTHGMKAGEKIVVNGLQRAQPGTQVKPNPVAMTSRSGADDAITASR
jgi:multidrug efflux system membrane fusion protein